VLEGEIDKLVFVGEGKSLTNWLLRAWWWLTKWLLWAFGRVYKTSFCGRGGEFDKLVIVGVGESLTNWLLLA
jgi:hypothetical protein